MRKRLITLGLLAALTAALVSCGEETMSNAWSATNAAWDLQSDSWTITADSVNGHATRNVTLSSDSLVAMHAKTANSSGRISLVATQGSTERTFDINGDFDENIDMSDFSQGKVSLRLEFEDAKDVDVFLNW
ncbi:MAG: hypothetical protein FWC55_04930 [Firmicutes bacterium]|nr:hypothetical protein [Bacillota bacterium]